MELLPEQVKGRRKAVNARLADIFDPMPVVGVGVSRAALDVITVGSDINFLSSGSVNRKLRMHLHGVGELYREAGPFCKDIGAGSAFADFMEWDRPLIQFSPNSIAVNSRGQKTRFLKIRGGKITKILIGVKADAVTAVEISGLFPVGFIKGRMAPAQKAVITFEI